LKKAKRILMIIILILFIALIGVGTSLYAIYREIKSDPRGILGKDEQEDVPELELEDGSKVSYDRDVVNILLLGMDRSEERDKVYSAYRSDTLILASVNMKTKKAVMLTIPRDTRTMVKKLDKNGNVEREFLTKINAAFAYGQGRNKYSYRNTIDAVKNLLGGIPIDYYVGLDMEGVIPIVDAVGGVEVDVEVGIPEVGLKPGKQVLKGEKALSYVRARKNVEGSDGSDTNRTKRQRKFVIAFLKKVKSMGAVQTAPALFTKTRGYVDTNMGLKEIGALAYVLKDLDLDEMEVLTVPGSGKYIDKVSYWVVDEKAMTELKARLFYHQNQ